MSLNATVDIDVTIEQITIQLWLSPGECLPEEVGQPGEAVVCDVESDEAGVERAEAQLLPQLQQVALQPQTGQPGQM